MAENEFIVLNQGEDESTFPTKILLKEEHFNKMLSMLDVSDSVAQKTWSLLLHLPTNENMLVSVKAMLENDNAQLNWNEIIPSTSVYKLLYSLQIIDLHMKQAKNKETDLSVWISRFIQRGGMDHLLSIILSEKISFTKTPLHKECLAVILRMTNAFLPAYAIFEKKQPDALRLLVDKIMRTLPIIYQTVTAPIVKVEESKTVKKAEPSKADAVDPGNFVERFVTENAVEMLNLIVAIDDTMFEAIYSHPDVASFLRNALLECQAKELRNELAEGLRKILTRKTKDDASKAKFITLLFSFVPDIEKYENTVEEYFGLLESLFAELKVKEFDEKKTLCDLLLLIMKRPVIEVSSTSKEDKMLVGLLNVCRVLLKANDTLKVPLGSTNGVGLIHELFYGCLFDVPFSRSDRRAPPKCKTKASRKAAFSLLVEFADKCPANFVELMDLVVPFVSKCERHIEWGFSPDSYEKSSSGFVGLRNLGATCYMNALMQQFFMTKPFRNGLLSTNIEMTQNQQPDDNLLLFYQLQHMFGFLQDSVKKYFDTRNFCSAYKDIEGNPVNVAQQQDANEFFNLFCDKIEAALKPSKEKELLKKIFGGVILNQIVYEDQVSETQEPFFILSLEIKNKKNILESLDLYTRGEMLEGDNKYFSEKLGRHVDANRRSLIKELPNILIFHLKRFDFDFEKMRNLKINDRCEFPTEIDMRAYSVEGIYEKEKRDMANIPKRDDNYYKYKLVGVLVHMGSADSGHYYSFIMDRTSKEHKWHEFNDDVISKFTADDLDKECFGGFDEFVSKDDTGKVTQKTKIYRRNNAYMLFYQRASTIDNETFDAEPTTVATTNSTTTTTASIDVESNATVESEQESNQFAKLKAAIDANVQQRNSQLVTENQNSVAYIIRKAIWEDNARFYYDKLFFNADFDAFLWHFVQSRPDNLSDQAELHIIMLSIRFIADILAHSKENDAVAKWFDFLQPIFTKNTLACSWLLDAITTNGIWRTELVLRCPIDEVRAGICRLIQLSYSTLRGQGHTLDDEPVQKLEIPAVSDTNSTDAVQTITPTSETKQVLKPFMEALLTLLNDSRFYYKQTVDLMQFLLFFVDLGFEECKFLIKREIIAHLVMVMNGDLYDTKMMGLSSTRSRMYGMSVVFGRRGLECMLSIVSKLVKTCETNSSRGQTTNLPPTLLRGPVSLELSQMDREKLFNKSYFASIIEEGVNLEAIADILVHWCWMNNSVSTNFAQLVITNIKQVAIFPHETQASIQASLEPVYYFLQVLEALLSIEDDIRMERANNILDSFIKHISKFIPVKPYQYDPTYICLKYISEQSHENVHVRNYLVTNVKELEILSKEHGFSLNTKKK